MLSLPSFLDLKYILIINRQLLSAIYSDYIASMITLSYILRYVIVVNDLLI